MRPQVNSREDRTGNRREPGVVQARKLVLIVLLPPSTPIVAETTLASARSTAPAELFGHGGAGGELAPVKFQRNVEFQRNNV